MLRGEHMIMVKSGTFEMLASTSVVWFGSGPIEVTVGPAGDGIQLKFFFESSPGQPQSFRQNVVGSQLMEFVLINFDNQLGTGLTAPIPIGTFAWRPLHLYFWVRDLGARDTFDRKQLDLSLYLGEILTPSAVPPQPTKET